MKRYFAAYEPVKPEWILVFSIVVRDEGAARPALLAMRNAVPQLRWTERGGWLEKEIAPQPPFEFLPTMLP